MEHSSPPVQVSLRRRHFLAAGALGSLALVGVKALISTVSEPLRPTRSTQPTAYLPESLRPTVIAAATAIIGEPGLDAYASGTWHPGLRAEALLAELSDADHANAILGLRLFEHGSMSMYGFSQKKLAAQEAQLSTWRNSALPLKRAVWGLLHGVATSSFAIHKAGWNWMDYPGPCLATKGHPGRPPGQTVAFAWDPKVP